MSVPVALACCLWQQFSVGISSCSLALDPPEPPPSDSTFRLLLAQLDVEGFEALLQQWMAAQPGVAETVDALVCDDKTLRGSIAENASGAARYGLRPTASTLPR